MKRFVYTPDDMPTFYDEDGNKITLGKKEDQDKDQKEGKEQDEQQ